MAEENARPQRRKWTGIENVNGDQRRLSYYINAQVQDSFGSQHPDAAAIVVHDAERCMTSVRMNFTPEPDAFQGFIRKMQGSFERRGNALVDNRRKVTKVEPFAPGTKESVDGFRLRGSPRLLLYQALINARDYDSLATDFPWNLLGVGQSRSR